MFNRISTTSKNRNTTNQQQQIPAFQQRKTLANHVQINMNYFKRHSYYQRIIIVAKHKNEQCDQRAHEIKDMLKELIIRINCNHSDKDKLTGLLLFYNTHSVYMLEGAEDYIGKFINNIVEIINEIFINSKVILVYNNINQRFFKEIVYKFAEPSVLIDKFPNNNDMNLFKNQIHIIIKKIMDLCTKIKNDVTDINCIDNFNLGFEFNKLIPEAELIDYILAIDLLPNVIDFNNNIYENIPELYHYDEYVWPIQYDFTIQHIFDYSEYKF